MHFLPDRLLYGTRNLANTSSPPLTPPAPRRNAPLSYPWNDPIVALALMVSAWLVFAVLITPRIIAYFLASRDLVNSPLATKLADFFAERALAKLDITPETIIPQVMEWAAKEENRPMLDKVMRNILQTDAITQATNILFEEAKSRIKAMFEGQLGADRKEIIGSFKDLIPEQAQAILEHPSVNTFLHAIQVAGQIAAMVGKKGKA